MSEMSIWLRFLLAVLATWRITHLLAYEDGPSNLVVWLRSRLGQRFFGKLMDCFHCLSFWVAAPLALFVTQRPLELLFAWPALSGAACLLERAGREPVVIEQIPNITKGETKYGMLR